MHITAHGLTVRRRDLYLALGLAGCGLLLTGVFSPAVYMRVGFLDTGRGVPTTYFEIPGSHGFLVLVAGLYMAALVLAIRRTPAILMSMLIIGIVLFDRHALLNSFRFSPITSQGLLQMLEAYAPPSLGPAWVMIIVGGLMVSLSALVYRPEQAEAHSAAHRKDFAIVATLMIIAATVVWTIANSNHDALYFIGVLALMLVGLANDKALPDPAPARSTNGIGNLDGQWRTVSIDLAQLINRAKPLLRHVRHFLPGDD